MKTRAKLCFINACVCVCYCLANNVPNVL